MNYHILNILLFVLILIPSEIYAGSLQNHKDEIAAKSGQEQLLLLEGYLKELNKDSIDQKEALIRFTIKQLQKDDKYSGRVYLKLAEVLLGKEKFVKALDTIFLSKDLMDTAKDSVGYGYYYFLVGQYYLLSANNDKSIQYYDSSLIYFKRYKLSAQIGEAYKRLGWVYFQKNDFYKAIDYNKKSTKIFLKLNDKKSLYGTISNLMLVYKNSRMLDDAIECQEQLIELEKELNIKPALFPTLYNRASIYAKKNNYLKAKGIIEPAYNELAKKLFGDNKPNTGRLPALAIEYPKEVEAFGLLAKRLALINHRLNKKEDIFRLTDLAFWSIVYTKNKEIERRSNIISSAKEKYDLEKKSLESDLALSKEKAKAYEQRILLIIVIGIGLLASLSLGIYYRSNKKLEDRNELIEKQQEKIVDSINYASKIQHSILLPEDKIREHLSDFSVFYKPRDIVSGDFYWFGIVHGIQIIAAIDCTGHGVPGAFMSMIGNTLLNEIVLEKKITDPGEILISLNEAVIANLHQAEEGVHAQDGMDLSLCSIDSKNEVIKYAGAKNPLYLIRNGAIETIKADPFSIGGMYRRLRSIKKKHFVSKNVPYSKGMHLFMFTDGYTDQFGSDNKKVFNSKRFKKLLLNIYEDAPINQKNRMAEVMDKWQGDTKQIDDMLVLGFRV